MDGAADRVVVLLGASGSGKTVLAAALLAAAGAPPASAPGPGRLAHGLLRHRGVRVSVLDPPGAPDLGGELHAAVRAAGAAVFVVNPVQGVDARTAQLWHRVEALDLPRLVVLTQLDRPGADADEAVAVCRRVFGETVHPLHVPLHDDDGGVGGLLDLATLEVSQPGSPRRAPEPEHLPLVAGLRDDLLEAVLTGSEDDEVFGRWLDGEEPPREVLLAELAGAVARGDVQPVAVAAPRRRVGVADLLDLLVSALPAASERPAPTATTGDGSPLPPLPADPAAPLVAEVVRAGPPVLLRVWSGTLDPGAPVRLAGGPDQAYDGPRAVAGQLAEAGLDAEPGQVLTGPAGGPDAVPDHGSGAGQAVVLEPWGAPTAQFPVGVPDDPALAARVRADPVARLVRQDRTGQLLLWSAGPEHAELLLHGIPAAPVEVPPGGRPVRVRVRVPRWAERSVRSDLADRRAQVELAVPDGEEVLLDARLPPAELVRYAPALARVTSGTGCFEPTGATEQTAGQPG